MSPFQALESTAVLFYEDADAERMIPMNVFSVAPAILVGAALAIVSGGFTKIHLAVSKFRARHVNRSKVRQSLEPVAFAVFISLLWALLPLMFPCREVPAAYRQRDDLRDLRLIYGICDENGGLHRSAPSTPTASPSSSPMSDLSMRSGSSELACSEAMSEAERTDWKSAASDELLSALSALSPHPLLA